MSMTYSGRHPDAIEGDLNGATEQLVEGRPGARARVDRLTAELNLALVAGPAALHARFIPAGYELHPDWEGSACAYDGEVEIASGRWGVDEAAPDFWRIVEQRMIDARDSRVVRKITRMAGYGS